MFNFDKERWDAVIQGYVGKDTVDANCEKNMDVFVGEVFTETYLPMHSVREHAQDYTDRLNQAKNSFYNWVRKIYKIYRDTIFRFTEPIRKTQVQALRRFMDNCNGGGMSLAKFAQNRIFLLNQVHGGGAIVVDKPTGLPVSALDQKDRNLYPYAYTVQWPNIVNFEFDEFEKLQWILFYKGKEDDKKIYKYWDREGWAIVDEERAVKENGNHGLGVVPVILNYSERNPKYDFQTPISPFDDIVRLTLKIFNHLSNLDQMIANHCYLKLMMPKSMYENLKTGGMGNTNVLIFEDAAPDKAEYLTTPETDFAQMFSLIFDRLPGMILEMATIRDKTDRPREESGTAKFMDSTDEMSNLLEKAEIMEATEQEMLRLVAKWEGVPEAQFTIEYSKQFDIKSTNEQLMEMIQLFKQIDGHAPTLAKEALVRVARKMLGNVDKTTWEKIEKEINDGFDPSLELADVLQLLNAGILDVARAARMYNPELADQSDEAVAAFVKKNLEATRGFQAKEKIEEQADGGMNV